MNKPVGFPTRQEYNTALRNHTKSFVWDRLSGAQPQPNGMSYFWGQGSFAVVSKVLISGVEWALRLPIAPQDGVHERSLAIAEEVANGNPLFVPFEYTVNGIDVPVGSGSIRPVTLMLWVQGLAVRDFVIQSCINNNSRALLALRDSFTDLAENLKRHGVVHGDLSPDNILVNEKDNEINLQLVDFDSVLIERVGDIPTSVGRTQMRHPGGPRQPDSHSDKFPLLIYYAVLTALAAKPALGVSPDNYDQKFLVDSQILGRSSQLLQELIDAAPAEMNELLESFNGAYTDTPTIVRPIKAVAISTQVILASDWVEITKRAGHTIEVHGSILGVTNKNGFLIMAPSNFNRHTTIVVRHLGFPQIRPQLGDVFRAIGTVTVEGSQISIQAPFIEIIDHPSAQVLNDAKFAAVRHRIEILKGALKPRKTRGIRVPEIAKELGITTAEVIDLSRKLGIGVKGPASMVIDAQADRIRARAERDGLIRRP